jgi:hypothetical protein
LFLCTISIIFGIFPVVGVAIGQKLNRAANRMALDADHAEICGLYARFADACGTLDPRPEVHLLAETLERKLKGKIEKDPETVRTPFERSFGVLR